MYTYMAYPCDDAISLEKKIESFLSISLGAYRVPEREQKEIIAFIKGLDIRKISEQVMQVLFEPDRKSGRNLQREATRRRAGDHRPWRRRHGNNGSCAGEPEGSKHSRYPN